MKKRTIISTLLFLSLLLLPLSRAHAREKVVLEAISSASIHTIHPDDNYSSGDNIVTSAKYNYAHDESWIIFKFETDNIPDNAVVLSAVISFYHIGAWGQDRDTMDMRIVRIIEPWNLHEVTWNNKPNYTIDATSSTAKINKFTDFDYVEWEVDSLLKNWIRHKDTNFGAYIKINFDEGPWISTFNSHLSNNKPLLTVEYSLPLSDLSAINRSIINPGSLLEVDLRSPDSSDKPYGDGEEDITTPEYVEEEDSIEQDMDSLSDEYVDLPPYYPHYSGSAADDSELYNDNEEVEKEAQADEKEVKEEELAEKFISTVWGIYFHPESPAGQIIVSARQNSYQLLFTFYVLLILSGVIIGIFLVKEIVENKKNGISFSQAMTAEWGAIKKFFSPRGNEGTPPV